jgi:hypothetical protein
MFDQLDTAALLVVLNVTLLVAAAKGIALARLMTTGGVGKRFNA